MLPSEDSPCINSDTAPASPGFSLTDINFWLPSPKEELFHLVPLSSVTHLFLKEMAFVIAVYSISHVPIFRPHEL